MPDATPAGFVPDNANLDIKPLPGQPAGFVPDSAAPTIVAVPGQPVGFVPDGAAPSVISQADYLKASPRSVIVAQMPADLAEAFHAGTMNPEQQAAAQPYIDAFRAQHAKNKLFDKDERPDEQKPKEPEVWSHLDTGHPALDASINWLKKVSGLDAVERVGESMTTGAAQEAVQLRKALALGDERGRPFIPQRWVDRRTAEGTAPAPGTYYSDGERDAAENNLSAAVKLQTVRSTNMLRTAADRVWSIIENRGQLDPKFQAEDNERADAQMKRDVGARLIEERLTNGEQVLSILGHHEVQSLATDPETVQQIAQSPLSDPTMLIPGTIGFKAARAEEIAARLLVPDELSTATALRQGVGRVAAVPVRMSAKIPATAAKILESNPLVAGAIAAAGTAADGGDVKDVALAAMLGVGAGKVGGIGKVATGLERAADRLAGRAPNGPMSRFAVAAYDVAAPRVGAALAAQLANMPFLLGAGDEDSAKTMFIGGALMHEGMNAVGHTVNALDISRSLWATKPTLPETRVQVKDYGVDEALDAAHQTAVSNIGNSGNNFVQAVRDYFGKNRGELYVLGTDDYGAALDRMADAGQISHSLANQARAQQGVTLTLNREDGPTTVVLSRVDPHTLGMSVGHEAGHILEHLLSPDELTSAYRLIGETYGSEQIAQYRNKYEQLANAGLQPNEWHTVLKPAEVLSEIFAEHVSAVLNSVPIARFSDPSMSKGVDLARSVYSLVGRGLEKIGAKVPELVSENGGTKTGLGIEPSARLGHLIENVLDAHRLDEPVLNGTEKPGEPPVIVKQSLPQSLGAATELPDARPAPEKPIIEGFKKGDPIDEIKNDEGVVVVDGGKIVKVNTPVNPDDERTYEVEYTHPDTGKKTVGTVRESWLQSKSGETPKGDEVIVPGHPMGPDTPLFIHTRTPSGEIKVGEPPATPTDKIPAKLPVPNQVENTVRPQSEAPNVRVTKAQQDQLKVREATPEEAAHNLSLFKAAADARMQGRIAEAAPLEINHRGAVAGDEAPEQITRERQRLASEAEADQGSNALKKIWQKIVFPFRVQDTSKGPTTFALSMDKILQNVDILKGWQKENGAVDPYLTSAGLITDLQNYLANQAHGYGGGGERFVRTADTREGSITPEDKNYKPVFIPRSNVEKINLLMGYNPASEVNQRTVKDSRYFKGLAEANGLKPGVLANGLAEVNSYRDRLRQQGFNLQLLNQATEQIRLSDVVGKAKPRPDLNFSPGDTGITKAGFMPQTPRKGAKEWVEAAALRLDDGRIFTGVSHPEIIDRLVGQGMNIDGDSLSMEDGFIDNRGRFLSREEAMSLAKTAGQLDEKKIGKWPFATDPKELESNVFERGRKFMPDRRPQGNDETRKVAEDYAGADFIPHTGYEPVNEELAKKIADFYEAAKSEPNDPEVRTAYEALINETKAQYQQMLKAGVSIEPFQGSGEPYKNSKAMLADVRDNKHLYFLKTQNAFGDGTVENDNPLLAPSGISVAQTELLANDLFRAVHDYFGHTAEGYEFGPRGELNAYLAHSRMFSDTARPALAAETLAQNSWVNFGKHLRRDDGTIPKTGDEDFQPLASRPFAEQKTVVVPQELLHEADPKFMPALQHAGPNLEHSIKDKTLELVHYGIEKLKTVDPKFMKPKAGVYDKMYRGENKSFFFVKGSEPKTGENVQATGKNAYEAKISGSRIYDMDSDALGLWDMINPAKADARLIKDGYSGYKVTTGDDRQFVALFNKTDVQPRKFMPELKPAPAEYAGYQEGFGDVSGFHQYNLTEDIPGHPKGSTVSERTLRKAGFEPPPADGSSPKLPPIMYHLTDDPNFKLDPKRRPENNSTLGGDWAPGIFLGDSVEHWVNGYGYWRPWVVEFDTSALKPSDLSFGHEGGEALVKAEAYSRLKVKRVVPLDAHAREKFGEIGWTEEHFGTDFKTGKPVKYTRGGERGYQYEGDARDESPEWQAKYAARVSEFAKTRTNAFMPSVAASRHLEDFKADTLNKALRRPGWAIITGTQEALGAADAPANVKANSALEAELTARRFPFQKVGGSYEGNDQGTSFLVTGISEKSARALGNRYNQETVQTPRGFLYEDGSVLPMKRNGTLVGPDALKQKGYTVLPDGTPFSTTFAADKVEPDVLETPAFKKIAAHLTPEELATVRRDTARDMVDLMTSFPKGEVLKTTSLLGTAKKGWYQRAASLIRFIFGDDTEKFVGLLSATSPQQPVEQNLAMTLEVWKKWDEAGRPTDHKVLRKMVAPLVDLNAREHNAIAALSGEHPNEPEPGGMLSGMKVESFRKNLLGDQDAVTNDTWMEKVFDMNPAKLGTKGGYWAMTVKVREIAKELGISPAEAQETIWSTMKRLTELTSVDNPADAVLMTLNEQDIKATPEFASLLLKSPYIKALLGERHGELRLSDTHEPAGAGQYGPAGALAVNLLAEGKSTPRVLRQLATKVQRLHEQALAEAKAKRDRSKAALAPDSGDPY